MAASANPAGNQDGSAGLASFQGGGGGGTAVNAGNGNSSAAAPDNPGPTQALKHDPGLSLEWTQEEQAILEEGLSKHGSEPSVIRYAKIAMLLPDKTVRDVAMRCKWMNRKGCSKKRKDDHNQARKINKKGGSEPSAKATTHTAARPGVPPYPLPMPPMDNDDEISFKAIGGPAGQLLEQNSQYFNQISTNISNFQLQDNINLFCQARDNILSIMNDMKDAPEIMKQMPPLPVKLNEELANSILPRATMPMQS